MTSANYILGPFGEDSDLRRWGLELAKRGGKNAKRRAKVSVARKLMVLMHRLWVTGEISQPLGYQRKKMVLGLYLCLWMTVLAIGRSCGLAPSTVSGYVGRTRIAKWCRWTDNGTGWIIGEAFYNDATPPAGCGRRWMRPHGPYSA